MVHNMRGEFFFVIAKTQKKKKLQKKQQKNQKKRKTKFSEIENKEIVTKHKKKAWKI